MREPLPCCSCASETAEKKGIKPLATIKSIGYAGVDPTIMGAGPVPSSRKALEKIGLQPSEIDYWEINEAFTIVALYAIQELGLNPDRVNVMGGGPPSGIRWEPPVSGWWGRWPASWKRRTAATDVPPPAAAAVRVWLPSLNASDGLWKKSPDTSPR